MANDLIEISLAFIFIMLAIIIFIHVSNKLRKGGGSLTTLMLGATDLFYNKEKRAAVSQIVEMKSEKKQTEPGSEQTIE